ncbi:MAG: type II toxin-antitoxin system RelE/ParE family toxin [Gammaproteobacteria bacterium]|nr:type II toxin-antitoxin system RelE/ParE family toxin [Gammaproteobacteria bacterium]
MSNYFLSQIAEQDIDEIITFIALDNRVAAMKFMDSLFETLDMLSENAFIGHKRGDLTDKQVRFWPFKSRYSVF